MSAIFVTGAIGVGKSTLLRRVISTCTSNRDIYGFRTEKVSASGKAGETGRVFIYPATGQPVWDIEHCVAELTASGSFILHKEVFETLGVALLSDIPNRAIVLMDELGFLESTAPKFCEKVLDTLRQDCLILGAIKPLAIPFLDVVREYPDVTLFGVTEQNRNIVAEELMSVVRATLESANRNSGDIRYD